MLRSLSLDRTQVKARFAVFCPRSFGARRIVADDEWHYTTQAKFGGECDKGESVRNVPVRDVALPATARGYRPTRLFANCEYEEVDAAVHEFAHTLRRCKIKNPRSCLVVIFLPGI